jgi:hypothetical protein
MYFSSTFLHLKVFSIQIFAKQLIKVREPLIVIWNLFCFQIDNENNI